MLKKKAIIIALVAATTSSAYAFTDATGGSWNDTLKFDGAITNSDPVWQFEVPADTVALAKNLDIKGSDGTINGANTEWTLTKLNDAVFFHGNLKNVLPQGKSGITPEIKFSNTDVGKDFGKLVTITATGGNGESGIIAFDISSGAASAFTNTPSQTIQTNKNDAPKAGAAALTLMESTTGYSTYYTIGGSHSINSRYENIQLSLGADHKTNQFAGRAFTVESTKLSFPTASIPATWTASLPITVTVQ